MDGGRCRGDRCRENATGRARRRSIKLDQSISIYAETQDRARPASMDRIPHMGNIARRIIVLSMMAISRLARRIKACILMLLILVDSFRFLGWICDRLSQKKRQSKYKVTRFHDTVPLSSLPGNAEDRDLLAICLHERRSGAVFPDFIYRTSKRNRAFQGRAF
jgi:hypothetical protein